MRPLSNLFIPVLIAFFSFLNGCNPDRSEDAFVRVEGTEFRINDEPYRFVGTNLWYGAYLGQEGEAGNRDRLIRELDFLVENGITNLRILGASEESVFENSLEPVFIYPDRTFNEELLVGLDFLLAEMNKRNLKAVIFLNNYWEWSGGMSMYNSWFGDGPVIDPADGDWEAFMRYAAEFYQNAEAQELFRRYIEHLVTRVNSVTNEPYTEDTSIMAWQLANEPRPGRGDMSSEDIHAYIDWVSETATYIKSLDPNHLVSSGSEGETGSLDSMDIFVRAHDTPGIDYLTFHMWAKNWGWIDSNDMDNTFENALLNAEDYIERHVGIADSLQKPIVMEEFGFPRDGESYERNSSVDYRNQYYQMVFDKVEEYDSFAGSNFWSWGGFGEAQNDDYWWQPGDPFTGDPPQEPQGLNSVFADDESTLRIIKAHAEKL